MEPGALDKKATAAYLGIGLRTLERLINRGEIPSAEHVPSQTALVLL